MSSTVKAGWTSFQEGFFGSFKLAAALILAVIGVASAFVNGGDVGKHHQDNSTTM